MDFSSAYVDLRDDRWRDLSNFSTLSTEKLCVPKMPTKGCSNKGSARNIGDTGTCTCGQMHPERHKRASTLHTVPNVTNTINLWVVAKKCIKNKAFLFYSAVLKHTNDENHIFFHSLASHLLISHVTLTCLFSKSTHWVFLRNWCRMWCNKHQRNLNKTAFSLKTCYQIMAGIHQAYGQMLGNVRLSVGAHPIQDVESEASGSLVREKTQIGCSATNQSTSRNTEVMRPSKHHVSRGNTKKLAVISSHFSNMCK